MAVRYHDIEHALVDVNVKHGSTFYKSLFRLLVSYGALAEFAAALGIPSIFLLKLEENKAVAQVSERTFTAIMRPVAWLLYNGSLQAKKHSNNADEMRRILDPIADADAQKEVRQIILATVGSKLRLRLVNADAPTPEDNLMFQHAMSMFYKTDPSTGHVIFGWFSSAGEPMLTAHDSSDEVVGGVDVVRVMHLTFSINCLHELCTSLSSLFEARSSIKFAKAIDAYAHAQAVAKETDRRTVECGRACAQSAEKLGMLEQSLTLYGSLTKSAKEELRCVKNDKSVVDGELSRTKRALKDSNRQLTDAKGKHDDAVACAAELELARSALEMEEARTRADVATLQKSIEREKKFGLDAARLGERSRAEYELEMARLKADEARMDEALAKSRAALVEKEKEVAASIDALESRNVKANDLARALAVAELNIDATNVRLKDANVLARDLQATLETIHAVAAKQAQFAVDRYIARSFECPRNISAPNSTPS